MKTKYPGVYYNNKYNYYYFRTYIDGVQKNRSSKLWDTAAKAHKAKKIFEREFDDSNKESLLKNRSILFQVLVHDYLNKKEPKVTESSYMEIESKINKHILPYFKNKNIYKIRVKDIEDWKSIKIRETYIDKVTNTETLYSLKHLKAVFNHLNNIFERGRVLYGLKDNPCFKAENFERNKNVQKKSALNRDDFWDLNELYNFLNSIDDDQFYTLFILLGLSGLRIHELLALKVKNFNPFNRTLFIDTNIVRTKSGRQEGATKEGRDKVIYIPEEAGQVLLDYINNNKLSRNDRIFKTSYSSVHREYKKILELSGNKHIRLHGFRHTFATALLELGADYRTVAKMLGHSGPEQAQRTYGHLYAKNLKEISEDLNKELKKMKLKQDKNKTKDKIAIKKAHQIGISE